MRDRADERPVPDGGAWRGAGPDRPEPHAVADDGSLPRAAAGTVSILRPAVVAGTANIERSRRRTLRRGSRRVRELWFTGAACLVAAVGGALSDVAPTGNAVADRLFAAGLAALLAAAGATAKRWTWFAAAGGALALADGRVAVAAGGIALLVAFLATDPVRPAPVVGATVGGLAALALLRGEHLWFEGASALMAAAVTAPMLLSGYRHAGSATRRRVRRTVVASTVLTVAVVGVYGALLLKSRNEIRHGMDELESGMAAARDGDDIQAQERFAQSAALFGGVEGSLGSWWAEPAEMLPVIGHNARAIQAMASTAADLSREGEVAAAEADVDQLTVTEGRLDLDHVRSLEQPLHDVAAALDAAAARLEAVDTPWLAAPVADRVDRVRAEVAAARPDARVAADAVRLVPAIFGGDGESRWLVIFTTPVEARGRTGFVGNFAELTAIDGDVDMPRFGRSDELEAGGVPAAQRTLSGPSDYVSRWSRYLTSAPWRNITMSPDFPSIGQVMTELYPQSGGQPVEGVIAVDPTALAALLEFTGPVTVPGVAEPLTSENAAEFMLFDQYVELPDSGERVDVLENLARTTFDRLTSGNLPGIRTVADTLAPTVRDGHIQIYSTHPDQQDLFDQIDADGALPAVDGDSLAVVNSNAIGNKADRFLSRDIDYHATWDPTSGRVEATLAVTLVNNAPSAGLPDYVIGNSLGEDGVDIPPGTNRTHLSIYTPFAVEQADVDGLPVDIPAEAERDRYAYSLFLDLPPDGGTRVVTLELQGIVPVDAGGYRLDVAGQPLVIPDSLNVTVESTAGGPVRASAGMEVDGASASAAVRTTQHETTFRVRSGGAR